MSTYTQIRSFAPAGYAVTATQDGYRLVPPVGDPVDGYPTRAQAIAAAWARHETTAMSEHVREFLRFAPDAAHFSDDQLLTLVKMRLSGSSRFDLGCEMLGMMNEALPFD